MQIASGKDVRKSCGMQIIETPPGKHDKQGIYMSCMICMI